MLSSRINVHTAAMITLINECFTPPHKLVSSELKLKGLGSQIVHGRLLRYIHFEIGPSNHTFRFIYDVLSVNNHYFQNYVHLIYPDELKIKDTTESDPREDPG
jgi:hypothetical protein